MYQVSSVDPDQQVRKLQFLDGLRGLAAVYVVIGHGRALFWEGYTDGFLTHPDSYSAFEKWQMYFFSLFKFGHEAVLFFFVLSGFVIHLKYASNYSRTGLYQFQYGSYLVKRIKRIYPPFIFALLLTAMLDALGVYYNLPIYSGLTIYTNINQNHGHLFHDFGTLVGNLFFLYKVYCPIFGSNGPAWSLKFEWWFYMLYPALLLLAQRRIMVSTAVVSVLFVLAILPFEWPENLLQDVCTMLLSWWFGVLLAEVHCGRFKIPVRKLSWLMLSVVVLPVTSEWQESVYWTNVAIFFTGMLAFLLSSAEKWYTRLLSRLKPLGDFSYTLYIVHYPILTFLSGWLMYTSDGILPAHSMFILPAVLLPIILSYFIHFLTEVPFVRRKP